MFYCFLVRKYTLFGVNTNLDFAISVSNAFLKGITFAYSVI